MGHVRGQAYGYPRLCITYKGLKRKLAKYGFAPPDVCCVIVLNQKGIETQMMEDIVARSGIYAGTSSYMRTQPENYLESHATFLIDERVFPFRPEEFLKIAGALQNFIGAKYGYCYRTPDRCDPGSYPYFSDHVSVRKSDLDRSGKWYSFLSSRYEDPDEKALTAIRDIYRLNFLSREHLAIDAGGIPFGEWIKADPSRGTLKPVPGNENIYCWDIGDESLIPAISSTLAPFGFVISV